MTLRPFFTLAVLFVMPSLADCIDGSRDTTEEEKQFYVRTMDAVKAALPAAPAGWTLEDRTRISAPGSVCTGSGKLPLRGSYEVRFFSKDAIAKLDAIEAEHRKRLAALKQLPADKQAEYDEVARTSRDLDRQARKLMSTDKEQALKLAEQSKEMTKKAHEIRQAHLASIAPQIDALSKEQYEATKDVWTEVRLKVNVNGFNFEVPTGAETAELAKANVALRSPKKTLLAYGAWNRLGAGYKPVYSAGSTTRVANVMVEAIGDPGPAAQILSGLNAGAISGLIAR
ncbi:MAG TPA: hypothetical protein VEX68_09255 [Bryobacteraceae bacterium]|nr:hypothetical protein [Bryobacteraceae bacterium]